MIYSFVIHMEIHSFDPSHTTCNQELTSQSYNTCTCTVTHVLYILKLSPYSERAHINKDGVFSRSGQR